MCARKTAGIYDKGAKMTVTSALAVFIGGGLGSLCRYAAGLLVKARFGSAFPLGTLLVNLLGCLAIGYLAARFERVPIAQISQETRDLCVAGLLGGFTTFSAFGLETANLFKSGAWVAAAGNVLLNVALGVALAGAGLWLGRR
jgi:CrcB protein